MNFVPFAPFHVQFEFLIQLQSGTRYSITIQVQAENELILEGVCLMFSRPVSAVSYQI